MFPDNTRILFTYYNLMLSTNCKSYTHKKERTLDMFGLIYYRVCSPSSIFDQQHKYLLSSIMQDCLSYCLSQFDFIVPKRFKENYQAFEIYFFKYFDHILLRISTQFITGTRYSVFCCLSVLRLFTAIEYIHIKYIIQPYTSWDIVFLLSRNKMYHIVRTILKYVSKIVQVFQ